MHLVVILGMLLVKLL